MNLKRRYIVIFWIISFIILHRLFTIDYNNGIVDIVYTTTFHIPLVIIVHLNFIMIDKLLDKKRSLVYGTGVLCLCVLGVVLHYLIFDIISPVIIPQYFFISMSSILEISQYIIVYMIVSLLLKLSYDRFLLKDKQITLEYQYNKNQLEQLKSQLNPHLLFNSLNNIYSMSFTNIEQGRESIIKLSDTLRYMMYETGESHVKLSKELEHVENYIALERLRLENIVKYDITIPKVSKDRRIAPLILLPYIENVFKHCDKENPYIEINIELNGKDLTMLCKNNIEKKPRELGGIGVKNGKKRLQLLYEDRHTLYITEGKIYHTVILKLQLDE